MHSSHASDRLADSKIKIDMLGAFVVFAHEERIRSFRTHKTASLLAYLAFHPHSHAREEIAELLWPWSEPKAARHNLNQAVYWLRKRLEPAGVARGSVLTSLRKSVHLVNSRVQTDVAAFEESVEAADQEPDAAAQRKHLLRAARLYTAPLLTDHYENWITPERRRLASLHSEVLLALVEHYRSSGDVRLSLDWSHRAVAADPCDEGAARCLMKLLHDNGRSTKALEVYLALEEALNASTASPISDETRSLAQTLFGEASSHPGLEILGDKTLTAPDPRGDAARSLPWGMATFVCGGFRDSPDGVDECSDQGARFEPIFRQIVARHRGYPGKSPDDCECGPLCGALPRAKSAVACAVELYRAAQNEKGPMPGVVLVTCDLQTSSTEPVLQGGRLIAALARATQPGQVILDQPTASLLRGITLPQDVRIVELGVFRLPDQSWPERISQLVHPDLPMAAPTPPKLPRHTD
jgi:DNA-binding SARP family transcriptional activator